MIGRLIRHLCYPPDRFRITVAGRPGLTVRARDEREVRYWTLFYLQWARCELGDITVEEIES